MIPAAGVTLLVVLGVLELCQGHGYLRCPPGRSVLWRDEYKGAEENYQDNELNCGGRSTQWDVNGGKCGVCGDPYRARVEQNQPPNGKYAKAILTDCYDPSTTEYISAFVKLTANHKGYIEFRLCPNNDFNKPVTQECLDQNVLRIRDARGRDHGTRLKVLSGQRDIRLQVKIPTGMECEQCVIQWKYISGNSWGCEYRPRRRCGIGYGAQESFYNCADIAILSDCSKVRVARTPRPSSVCTRERGDSKPATDNAEAKTNEKTDSSSNRNTLPPKTKTRSDRDWKKTTSSSLPSSNNNNPRGNEEKNSATESPTTTIIPPTPTKPPTSKTDSDADSDSNTSDFKPSTTPAAKPVPNPAFDTTTEPSKETEEAGKICYAVRIWSNIRNMHFWCRLNCARGNCPWFMCACKTVEQWRSIEY